MLLLTNNTRRPLYVMVVVYSAFGDFVFASIILHFFVINFLG